MLFGNCKKSIQIQIQVDGVDIERVNENKFLGVIINDKLCWKSHIKHVHNKLSRSISILNKAKQKCSELQITPHSSLCADITISKLLCRGLG